jgi:hypothetical protein
MAFRRFDCMLSFACCCAIALPCHRSLGQSPDAVLRSAASSCGENAIHSADIEFRAVVESPPPSAEKVQAAVDRNEAALRMQVDKFEGQPEVQELYEKALVNNKEVVSEQVIANANREIVGVFRVQGPEFGGDRMSEVRVRTGNSEEWTDRISLLVRRLDPKSRVTLSFDSDARHAMIHGGAASVGITEPRLLGRLSDPVLGWVNELDGLEYSLDKEYSLEHAEQVCVTLSGSFEGQDVFGRVVTDPTRGHICPLVEFGFGKDRVDARVECSEFFLDESSGLWFPGKCNTETPSPSGPIKVEYTFRPSGVRLNRPLPSDALAMQLPAGTAISYQLGGRPQELESTGELSLTIDDLDKLPSHESIVRRETTEYGAVPENASSSRWLFVCLSVVAVLSVCTIVLRRKARANN